jgi:(p)ppGpp synthase/HD superfamily hydrolase
MEVFEPKIDAAINLALRVHAGQKHPEGLPAIVHSMAVMTKVYEALVEHPDAVLGYTREELLSAAILHDAKEDSDERKTAFILTMDELVRFVGQKVTDVIDALSRRTIENETYRDFIYRAKANPAARFIKTADLLVNLARADTIQDPKWRRKLDYKYNIALKVLNDADEPTWEQASMRSETKDGVTRTFVAEPNGSPSKEIEITGREEWKHLYAAR